MARVRPIPRDRAALVLRNVYDVQRLRKWYGDSHLVELALFVGALNLLDRFALAFALAPERAE